MYSARGVLNLVHSPADMDAAMRRGNAMRLNGIDAEFLDRDDDRALGARSRLLARCALPDPGRPAAAARRHGAPRRRGLGLRARRRRARRRHHPAVRGDRHLRIERRRSHRRRDLARLHRRAQGRASPWPATRARSRRWPACACRSSRTCCRRWCPNRSSRCSTPWSPRAPCISTSASRTRASW